jgi:putative DNA methylase
MTLSYPKRLIEVDLPIARISAHARREKSIRHGHISTLHIWWARRPLAACRAVICAALWPDPGEGCPPKFRADAVRLIAEFAKKVTTTGRLLDSCSPESFARWEALAAGTLTLDPEEKADWGMLRLVLLDFIADFANWDNSTVPEYLEIARALTQSAHESLGGEPGTRPLVVDPFAGGGSIPLEALRVGADAFASDLNPVAVLLNKVVLEYIPKYGQRLADEVRKWGQWIKAEAEKELAEFYPKDPDGATPIAYLWARTIRCEGTGCGAEVPVMRSLWLAKKGERSIALRIVANAKPKRVDFEIVADAKAKGIGEGTAKRGSVTCPVCGFTTPVKSVREQLKKRRGGANDARLFCVVTTRPGQQGRYYRLPNDCDLQAINKASTELERRKKEHHAPLALVPNEILDVRGIRHTWAMIYGLEMWEDFFTHRQALALTTIARLLIVATGKVKEHEGNDFAAALQTSLAMVLSRQADALSASVTWTPGGEFQGHTFTRQALAFVWDFAEVNPWCDSSGNFAGAVEWVSKVCGKGFDQKSSGSAQQASATRLPLPDNSATAFVTDPPYYDAVPYSYLSEFFHVWLRRAVGDTHVEWFRQDSVPKDEEIVVDRMHALSNSTHDISFYEGELSKAFSEGQRILRRDGVGLIVFASKTTASWEAILQAVIDANWIVTGSWPIDTEREARVSAQGQSRLASSVHLVCRPRTSDEIGDWRDTLSELPKRIHEWMPRLAAEGVVGADAIFACLGPALEIFSRYSRVEKASGETATLREYLEHVWAAVSTEALSLIFKDADAAGLEPDARLTAMWLWTLGAGAKSEGEKGRKAGETEEDSVADDEEGGAAAKAGKLSGFTLEYDAARKIAQGLGVHLEQCEGFVEVHGDKARLLPVAERSRRLFGKETTTPAGGRKKKKVQQKSLFEEAAEAEGDADAVWGELKGPPPGTTALDRLHQAMILFGAQRGELLKRFLVEDGVGKDARFWKLAQSLSALYPAGSDEKRWVDGILARKKGLGL